MTLLSRAHHLGKATRVGSFRGVLSEVSGFNAKAALIITDVLGSMVFFWFANVLALISLPAVLTLVDPSLKTLFPAWLIKTSLISLIAWITQTYIQLVSLPVLQVSSNAQGRQQEHDTKIILEDAETTREHTSQILDTLDTHTQGGLQEILSAIQEGNVKTEKLVAAIPPPKPPRRMKGTP